MMLSDQPTHQKCRNCPFFKAGKVMINRRPIDQQPVRLIALHQRKAERLMRCASVIAGLLLTACAGKTLKVESDTAWVGTIDQFGAVQGRGNADYDLGKTSGEVCWTFQKVTSLGTLRVYSDDQTWFGLGSEIDGEMTTRDPSGTVQGCSS